MTRLLLALLLALLLYTLVYCVRLGSTAYSTGLMSRDDWLMLPPIVQTEPAPEPVQLDVRLMRISFYTCSAEELTSPCIEHYTGDRPTAGTAASSSLPEGIGLDIEGFGLYTVRDKCDACKSDWLDVFWPGTRAEAFDLGVQMRVVTVTIGGRP